MQTPDCDSVSAETKGRILDAIERIVDGSAKSRALTYATLAREAGIGLATLNRAPTLKKLFSDRVEAVASGALPAATPELRVIQLERVVENLRTELGAREEQVELLAQQLQYAVLHFEHGRTKPTRGSKTSGDLQDGIISIRPELGPESGPPRPDRGVVSSVGTKNTRPRRRVTGPAGTTNGGAADGDA